MWFRDGSSLVPAGQAWFQEVPTWFPEGPVWFPGLEPGSLVVRPGSPRVSLDLRGSNLVPEGQAWFQEVPIWFPEGPVWFPSVQLVDIFVTFAQGRCAACGTLFVGGEGDEQRVLVGSEGDHIQASTKSLNPRDLHRPNQTHYATRLAELFDHVRKVCGSSRCHPQPTQST